ncbi:MAG: hypothetical protein JW751_06745 [Polyangiaceae bacterium]|nr:hypothetical protein [Polyangiaceae bacterium]
MARTRYGRVGLVLALGLLACGKEKPAPVAEAAPPEKQGAARGGACETNSDCADRLGCAKDKTCQSYKTIECQASENSCRIEGRCTGEGNRCIAGSAEECKASEFCTRDGRCTVKEGRCVAASASDCETVCKRFGRCTPQEDKCMATDVKQCRESELCQGAKTCKLSNGVCIAG